MDQFNNTMEIFKLLDKSNCKECNKPTCLAFAAAVFQGQKELNECPHLDIEIIKRCGMKAGNQMTLEQERDETIEQLKRKITSINLSSSAQRLGAIFSDEKLTIKILGKNFGIDKKGSYFF